ncbi:MAG TPA: DUF4292 domain-containing protein [Ignavibacteriaceae bacterium]
MISCVPSKPLDEVEILPSERLINRLEANRRKIKNFEGVGVISIESDIINNSASFRVIMQKPDSIYFNIMGPFGIEMAQAVVTDKEFIFYDAMQNTAYTGYITDEVIRNIFKVNLSFNDLLDAFVGSVNLTQNLYKQPNEYNVDFDKYVLTYIDYPKKITTTYRVDVRELAITNFTVKSSDGRIDLEGKYSDFELIEDVAIPFTIEVSNNADNNKIKISYKDVVTNQKGIKIDFVLPDDASLVKW